MHVTTIGVDLAKQVFAVHRVDQSGKTAIRKMVRREQMVLFLYPASILHGRYKSLR